MENENNQGNSLTRTKNEMVDRILSKIPKRLRYFIIGVGILFLLFINPIVGFLADVQSIIARKNNLDGAKTQEPLIEQIKPSSADSNCYTQDWVPFTENYWDGLSRFQIVNGVFSLPSIERKVDTVMFFKKSCKGGVKAELKFTPISEEFINLDLYYGSWFRWEIGGRDVRSIRLYKNTLGCSAMKDVVKIQTSKTFLDNKEEIAPNKPVWVRFYIYLTDSGKVRTEIFLDFYSKKTGEKIVNEGGFYHEFDVDLICDSATNKVLNIDEDYERVGIGLVKFWSENISPEIALDEFKIDPK